MTVDDLESLDREDVLAEKRALFALPSNTIYLDGNSLGALPSAVEAAVAEAVTQQWGQDLIASWNKHSWIELPLSVGEKIAPLLGAAAGQVVCADSISVNLFKLLSTALSLQSGRHVILSQEDNFPTDLYMVEGLVQMLGAERCQLRTVDGASMIDALDDDVAVLLLTHVNFRSGHMHDMQALTAAAHEQGVLVLWDLAHSAGVTALELDRWNVDMAVGCGYKFLNGGPGAPAFLYLASRHQDKVAQPLSGWMGHRRAFDFASGYEPAAGVQRYLSGTPGILGMTALDAALDVFGDVSMGDVRAKSSLLTQCFIERVQANALDGLRIVSPTDSAQRGSQVSLSHERAYAIAQALIEEGVVVDFRAPDIVRFGFSPLYNSFREVGIAAETLAGIVREQRFLEPRFQVPSRVT
ncbi:MAG: kynureninase [Halioglobus sp.]